MLLLVPGQFHRLLRVIPADIFSRILLHADFVQLLRLLHVTSVRFLAAHEQKRIAAFFLRVQPCRNHCRARSAACLRAYALHACAAHACRFIDYLCDCRAFAPMLR